MTLELGSLLDRVPPQNLEAEQSALGAMMIDREALDKGVDMLKPEDFYRTAHQTVFEAMVSLAVKNEPVDIVTVQEELRSKNRLEDVGGTLYLMALIDSVPSAANIEYYCGIVEEKSILRRAGDAGAQIMALSHGQVDDMPAFLAVIEQKVFHIGDRQKGKDFACIKALSKSAIERVEGMYRDKGSASGLRTGFGVVDRITRGLQPADFVIVAGRPSMGKTAFVTDIVRHVSIREGLPVAVFSLEMSEEALAMRLLCSESRIDSHRMQTGYLRNDEHPALAEGFGRLYDAPIHIDDTVRVTAMQMHQKCRRLQAEKGLSLVIVDYLQLMESHRRTENRTQEVSEIARSLKNMARELKVPVIALSQLSRAVEQRPDKRPMLSDLRESGSIEAEADVVMMLYRASYYRPKEDVREYNADEGTVERQEFPDIAEVIVAKQRNGPTGTVRLLWQPEYASFANLEERRTE